MNDNDLFASMQILDLKHLSDIEQAVKEQCRDAIKQYKSWRTLYALETDQLIKRYSRHEGEIHHNQAIEYARLYWQVRTDRRKAFATYIDTKAPQLFANQPQYQRIS
ncbi:MAG: hypothetical protein AAF549_07300 [Pseudomonadota bacterium]